MSARIDRIKEILVYLVIIFLPVMSIVNVFGKVKINMALSDVFAALIVLLTIIDYKKFSLKRNFPYWWYFAGLMGLMLVSNTLAYFNPNIVSGSILSAVNEFIKFAISGVYYFIGYNFLSDRGRITKVLRIWIYTALAVSVIGIAILFNTNIGLVLHLDIPARALKQRLVGTLTDPNLAAAYLGVSFYISLLFLSTATRKSDKYIGIISLVVIATSIVLTQSRSGIIAFIVSILLYVTINIKKLYKYITIILLIVFIGYFGVLNLDAVYFSKQLTSYMDTRMGEVIEGKGEADRRVYLAKAAYLMGKDNVLIGVGRGNYLYNNDSYFEKLGLSTNSDYYQNYLSNFIPHNTYMTFFAELGLIGLLLFLTAFIKIIKLNLRRNYTGVVIVSLMIYYLVQATAVNLENFRGVWFILGLAYIYGIKPEPQISKGEYKSCILLNKKILVWNIALLFLSIFVFLNAAPHYTNPILLDNGLLTQDVTNLGSNEDYVFRYLISTETENISVPSSRISICGVNKDNKEILLNQITHYAPNGYGNLTFIPGEDIKEVIIEVEPLNINNAMVSINNAEVINTRTGEGQRVFTDFKYFPDSIEGFTLKAGLIKATTEADVASLNMFADKIIENEGVSNHIGNEDIVYFDGNRPINLSNKVLFLGARFEQQSVGQAKLSLIFKCIGKMDIDYNIWLHGITIDKGVLPEERREYGFNNWSQYHTIDTTDWEVGQLCKQEYMISATPGQYDIQFGFWNPKWKDGKAYRLYPGIDLGNIQIK